MTARKARHEGLDVHSMLTQILKEVKKMVATNTKLAAAFAKLTTADDALLASYAAVADQVRATAGDADEANKLADAIDAETAKVQKGLDAGTITPPAPAPAPATDPAPAPTPGA